MRRPDATEDPAAGFTLIEVIVSFLILAMVLGSATLSISYSARLYRKADEISAAGQLAQGLIAEKFDRRPGQPEREAGTEGALRWTITRKILAGAFTANGGRLIGFDLALTDRSGRVLDRYSSLYVERQP